MFVKRVGVGIWGTGGHRTDVYWPLCADGSCMPAQPVGGGGGLNGVGAAVEMHAAVAGCQYVPIHWAVAKDGLLTRKP